MAEKPAAEAEVKPKSKKKLLVIIGAAVLVLLLAAVAVLFLLMQNTGNDEFDEDAPPVVEQARPRAPPVFLALDPITINLADPGVIRFAQVGITLQLENQAANNQINAFMPAVRNGILRQVSRRTAQDLLNPDGKDQLAADILQLVRQETGLVETARAPSPIQAVLFASLIVQ